MDMSAVPTKRSASHGSLNSTFKSQGKTLPRNPTAHRPLKSVNENMALLSSPGPLQSMLKTTTETGDIGIFSIRPSPSTTSSSFSRHKTQRSRPSVDSGRHPSRPTSRGSQSTSRRDDRRRLPSYRDTTSEILSLYGSGTDSQPSSCLSSLSPPNDENGLRSYSMTTCGSRQFPSNKSSGTLIGQSGVCAAQRPRSPFPYPTRLKRPGVRPSSPALTDNGSVDYSRMVEIDRISYRTVHGPYRPVYPPFYRRPPPLSLRNDYHQPDPPTCLRDTAAPYGRTRSHSSQSDGQWPTRGIDQFAHCSGDYSARSSSLTSIIELYHRPVPPRQSPPPLPSGASFYYDYTEGFDNYRPQVMPIQLSGPPLAPIPQRVSSFNRPLVLRDETQARLDAVVDISVKDLSDSSVRDENTQDGTFDNDRGMQLADEVESVRSISRYETPALEPGDINHGCPPDDLAAGSMSKRSSTLAALLGKEVVFDDAVEIHSSPVLGDIQIGADKNRLRDPASPQEQPDRDAIEHAFATAHCAGTPTDIEEEARNGAHASEKETQGLNLKRPKSQQSIASGSPSKRASSYRGLASLLRASLHNSLDPGLSDLAALVSSFDRVARTTLYSTENPQYDNKPPLVCQTAALQMKPAGLGNAETAVANGIILSPQPISPARQLRVRNSIPKIEKALPPTPSDLAHLKVAEALAEEDFALSFSPFHLSDLSTPKTSYNLPPKSELGGRGRENSSPSPLARRHFRFKRSPAVPRQPQVTAHAGSQHEPPSCRTPYPKPRGVLRGIGIPKLSRLGLKFSGTETPSDGVDTDTDANEGTVRRHARAIKESAPTILPAGNNDLFSPPCSSGRHIVFDSQELRAHQPQTRNVLLGAPVSLARQAAKDATRFSISTEGGVSEVASFHSDVVARPQRLRKKISNLRIRMTKSRMQLRNRALKQAQQTLDNAASDVNTAGRKSAEIAGTRPSSPRGSIQSTQSARISSRMWQWVREAKRAVHTCVKRRRGS